MQPLTGWKREDLAYLELLGVAADEVPIQGE